MTGAPYAVRSATQAPSIKAGERIARASSAALIFDEDPAFDEIIDVAKRGVAGGLCQRRPFGVGEIACESAWKIDPLTGDIGVQK
jgi:hypothetical protein